MTSHADARAAAYALWTERGLRPLVPYPGADHPWPSLHLPCGIEVSPRYTNVRRSRLGYSTCSSHRLSGEVLSYLLATYLTPAAHEPGWLYSTVQGYGQISIPRPDGTKIRRVHSYVCELAHGPAPSPAHVARHSCPDNRACFWAEHLSWGTHSQNRQDQIRDAALRLPPSRRHHDVSAADIGRIRVLRGFGTSLTALATAWDIPVEDVRFLLHSTYEPWPGD